jgi:hypothetical protein
VFGAYNCSVLKAQGLTVESFETIEGFRVSEFCVQGCGAEGFSFLLQE